MSILIILLFRMENHYFQNTKIISRLHIQTSLTSRCYPSGICPSSSLYLAAHPCSVEPHSPMLISYCPISLHIRNVVLLYSTGHLHIKPTETASPCKPMPWSCWCRVCVLRFMSEDVLCLATARRSLVQIQSGAFLCGVCMFSQYLSG